MTPGRKPSITASAVSISRSTTSDPAALFRSIADGATPTEQDRGQRLGARVGGTVDADHLRAEVGQDHSAERAGTDPAELDHAHACQGAGASGGEGHLG